MNDNVFKDFDSWLENAVMPPGKRKTLRAAAKLFSEQGYDRTSTAQIEKTAGISEGTVFKYFKSKENLKAEIIYPIISTILPLYGDAFVEDIRTKNLDLESFIRFIVYDRFQFIKANKEIVMIILNELVLDKNAFDKLVEILDQRFDIIRGNFEKMCQANPNVREEVSYNSIVRMLVGQLVIYFLQRFHFSMKVEEEAKELEAISKNIIHAILK